MNSIAAGSRSYHNPQAQTEFAAVADEQAEGDTSTASELVNNLKLAMFFMHHSPMHSFKLIVDISHKANISINNEHYLSCIFFIYIFLEEDNAHYSCSDLR